MTHLAQHDPGGRGAMVEYLAYFNLPVRLPEFAIGMWLASAALGFDHGLCHLATVWK